MFVEVEALRRKAKAQAKQAKADAATVNLPPPVNAVARAVSRRAKLLLSVRQVHATARVADPDSSDDIIDAKTQDHLDSMLRLLRMPVERKTVTPVSVRLRQALSNRLKRAQTRASTLRLLADQLQSTRLSQVPCILLSMRYINTNRNHLVVRNAGAPSLLVVPGRNIE